MSGTKEKTTGKQNAKGRAGKVSAQEVAQADAFNTAGTELPATLPGYYGAVGSRAISVDVAPLLASEEHNDGTASDVVNTSLSMGIVPATDDVEVLSVCAVSDRGFWRCGIFWPRESRHVFATDDPDGDAEINALDGEVVFDCFVSHETAARLKAEPNLQVKVIVRKSEI